MHTVLTRLGTSPMVGAVLFALTAPRVALADDLPGGGTLTFSEYKIYDGTGFVTGTTEEITRYFGLAGCQCSEGDQPHLFQVKLSLVSPTGETNRPGEIWFGTSCDNDQLRDDNCVMADEIADIDTLATAPALLAYDTYQLMAPTVAEVCHEEADTKGRIWVAVDTNGDGSRDHWVQGEIAVDTKAPTAIAGASAQGAEGAIALTWSPPAMSDAVQYYQALCVDAAGAAVLPAPRPPEAKFQNQTTLCGLPSDETFAPVALPVTSPVDAAPAAPTNITRLVNENGVTSAAFICGQAAGNSTSMRIDGLANGVPVYVALLAIDAAGNTTGVYFTQPLVPAPVTDFWEDINERGGEIEGGFCLIASGVGEGPWTDAVRGFRDGSLAQSSVGRAVVRAYYGVSAVLAPLASTAVGRALLALLGSCLVFIGLVWDLLGAPLALLTLMLLAARVRASVRAIAMPLGSMSRRHRATARFALTMVVALSSAPALAQNSAFSVPLSQRNDETPELAWSRFGIRVGPYYPAIDEGLGLNPGPYGDMFGKKARWIPHFEYDRFFLHPAGQLGLGISLGLRWQNAKAYTTGPTGTSSRPRSDADSNKFIMVPTTLTAVYRLTVLDDRYHFPIVPYVRGGLAYWMWWIKRPGGGTAFVTDGCDPALPSCERQEGSGATLGYVASVGLALRAERIDSGAAWSMRDSGIQHAGFFAELTMSRVDGFGKATKLNLSDNTFSVGVDFEF